MFAALTAQYYRGAKGVVYVFSTTDRESFLAIDKWRSKVEEQCGKNVRAVLVQNKVDLLDEAAITTEEAEGLAKRLGLKLYRTCVLENLHVDETFQYLAEQCISSGAHREQEEAGIEEEGGAEAVGQIVSPTVKLTMPSKQRTDGKKSQKCCK